MVLPKNCMPFFFGTCYNLILQKNILHDTKDYRKCCVYSNIILCLPCPAKQCLVKGKKKIFKTVLIEALSIPVFFPSGLHFDMLRSTRKNQKFLYFFQHRTKGNKMTS